MYEPSVFRKMRLAGGFTFREVAQEAGLDPSAVAAYEVGRSNPSVGAMNRWERALLTLLDRRAKEVDGAFDVLKGREPSSQIGEPGHKGATK